MFYCQCYSHPVMQRQQQPQQRFESIKDYNKDKMAKSYLPSLATKVCESV